MKILILIALTFCHLAADAQINSGWRENYSEESSGPAEHPTDLFRDEDYVWLYELLFAPDLRLALPKETFKSFRVHLKDTYKVFPHPSLLSSKTLSTQIQRIEGKITYAGFFPKKYRYDIIHEPTLLHHVRIFLEDATEQDFKDFAQKLNEAQQQWNRDRVQMDFDYAFDFQITKSKDDAHYSVKVLDDTRGPYDRYWSRNWTAVTIAHELGHMLGLGDEYDTISGKTDCLTTSLMCGSWSGHLMYHNYYFILRRLVQVGDKPQP